MNKSLEQQIKELDDQRAVMAQELRAQNLQGAKYVLFSDYRGFYAAENTFNSDPAADEVLKFNSPREALESLTANPISGDPAIKRFMNGAIDATFHAEYLAPNNRRESNWLDDWKFYDSEGALP